MVVGGGQYAINPISKSNRKACKRKAPEVSPSRYVKLLMATVQQAFFEYMWNIPLARMIAGPMHALLVQRHLRIEQDNAIADQLLQDKRGFAAMQGMLARMVYRAFQNKGAG